jgi:hypothetical protein
MPRLGTLSSRATNALLRLKMCLAAKTVHSFSILPPPPVGDARYGRKIKRPNNF